VKLLVDTPVLLWWFDGESPLSAEAATAIGDPTNRVLVSAASLWEMAIKRALGKLAFPERLIDLMGEEGFQTLPIAAAHALLAGALPAHHTDPFDRMLVAQTQLEGCRLVTRDTRLGAYGVPILAA
jgi:PIN domain nuclease of toxin-antitoxin system